MVMMGGGETIITRILEDVLPCISMLVVEACTIFLTITASTAMASGMSPFVFVVYTNTIASIIILTYASMSHRLDKPLFTSHLLWRVFFLGLIGATIAQTLSFLGLFYSSPIVAISMANVIPALSYMLTAIVSMLSAFICGLCYYTLIWGNIRDEEPPKCVSLNHGDSHSSGGDNLLDEKVPLLEGEEVVKTLVQRR